VHSKNVTSILESTRDCGWTGPLGLGILNSDFNAKFSEQAIKGLLVAQLADDVLVGGDAGQRIGLLDRERPKPDWNPTDEEGLACIEWGGLGRESQGLFSGGLSWIGPSPTNQIHRMRVAGSSYGRSYEPTWADCGEMTRHTQRQMPDRAFTVRPEGPQDTHHWRDDLCPAAAEAPKRMPRRRNISNGGSPPMRMKTADTESRLSIFAPSR